MPTYHSPSYRPSECCNADCLSDSEKEPCWGVVVVVAEDSFGDDDYYWVHQCEGHINYYDGDCKYVPEPPAPDPV